MLRLDGYLEDLFVFIGDTVHVESEVIGLKPLARLGGGSVVLKVKVVNQRDEVVASGEWNALMASKP
jgi:acyl dehydratase